MSSVSEYHCLLVKWAVFFSSEHQELSEQINTATDPRLQEDLERELDALVVKMEAKGDQIARLRRHQEKVISYSCLLWISCVQTFSEVWKRISVTPCIIYKVHKYTPFIQYGFQFPSGKCSRFQGGIIANIQ